MVKIKYNLTGSKRKSLAKALSEATEAEMIYLGMPSCGYQVGPYVVDKAGTIVHEGDLSQEDADQLTDKLEAAGFRPTIVEFDDTIVEFENLPGITNEEVDPTIAPTEETVLIDANDSEPSEPDAEDQITPIVMESLEVPDDIAPEPEEASTGEILDTDTSEDATDLSDVASEVKEQIKQLSEELAALEPQNLQSDDMESSGANLAVKLPPESEVDLSSTTDDETENNDMTADDVEIRTDDNVAETKEENTASAPTMECGSVISFSFPESVLDPSGWNRFECLKLSKYSLLKKSLKMDDLPTFKSDGKISFPWCVYDGNPERVNSTAQLIEAMINMAKNAKYISAEEKPIDNEKFSMRIFMVRLNLKGEKYKTARRILMENLSGNSAWKTGKPPQKDDKPMDGASSEEPPLNCQITANKPENSSEVPEAQNNQGGNSDEQA